MKKAWEIVLKILKYIVIAILVLFILVSLYQRFVPEGDGVFGFRTYAIISDSMRPKLTIGDVILVQEKKPSEIKVEDIITYKGMTGDIKDKIVTHQVEKIQIEDERYIFYTKGIATDIKDPAVYEEQIYGKVIYKFFIFSIISKILNNTLGFILLICIPLVLIYFSEIKEIVQELKKKKKKEE